MLVQNYQNADQKHCSKGDKVHLFTEYIYYYSSIADVYTHLRIDRKRYWAKKGAESAKSRSHLRRKTTVRLSTKQNCKSVDWKKIHEMATEGVKDNTSSAASSSKLFTRAEVAKHNDPKDTWIIIHNNVYNVTPFLNEVAIFSCK